jgi:hypothetical protein
MSDVDFKDGLFIAKKTPTNIFPYSSVWCRISEVTLYAHPKKPQNRLAKYKVVYWREEPTEESPDPKLLSLIHEDREYTEFYCSINISVKDWKYIEESCLMDFMQFKIAGNGYKAMKQAIDLLNMYRKDKYLWRITVQENDREVIVNDAIHETVYKGETPKYPPILFKSGCSLKINKATLELPVPYTNGNSWFREACGEVVSPNTLKAIVSSVV